MKTEATQNLSFSGEKIFVGIDVHKKQWTVTIMSANREHKTFVQPPEPRTLANYLRSNFPGASFLSVYEAGFSGFWIHRELIRENVSNIVVNPGDVPTTDKEKKQKYDHVDSRKLCRTLRDGELKALFIPGEQQVQDRELMRLRTKIIRDITRCKNRIKRLLNFNGIPVPDDFSSGNWSIRFLKWLKSLNLSVDTGTESLKICIDQLEYLMKVRTKLSRRLLLLANDERHQESVRLLRTIPGVGLIGALTFITELGDIRRFRNTDELCSYVGLIPNVYSSGERTTGGRITSRKNRYLQPILLQCAWKASSKDPALLRSYTELCRRMKGQKAIIRIARKLLNRIRYVLINKKDYRLAAFR